MRHPLARIAIAAACLWAGVATAGPLEPFRPGSWKRLLAAHAGHPLVVHFWGLSCAPCRKELPRWGKMLETSPDAPIVTINADLVPNAIEDAQAFLDQSGLAGAENYIFEERFAERLRHEIDPQWRGEIPLTLLIARNGTQTVIEGAAPASAVRDWFEVQSAETK